MAATVLVVDDDPATRELATGLIGTRGHRTIVAGDGAEAIDQARANNPDLILLDLGLPDRDGLDVCSDLREFTDVPILLLTGRADAEARDAGLERGATGFMTKPFTPKTLIQEVGELLDGAPAHA